MSRIDSRHQSKFELEASKQIDTTQSDKTEEDLKCDENMDVESVNARAEIKDKDAGNSDKCKHSSGYRYIFVEGPSDSTVVEDSVKVTNCTELACNENTLPQLYRDNNLKRNDSVLKGNETNLVFNADQSLSTTEVERNSQLVGNSFDTDQTDSDLFCDKYNANENDHEINTGGIRYIFDKNDVVQNKEISDDSKEMKASEVTEEFANNHCIESSDEIGIDRYDEQTESDKLNGEILGKQQIEIHKFENLENSNKSVLHTDENKTLLKKNMSTVSSNCKQVNNDNDTNTGSSTDRDSETVACTTVDASTCCQNDMSKDSCDNEVDRTLNDTVSSNQILSLNLPCSSPENDGRGVSPEIICLTHLSPTTLYDKEQLGVPHLLSRLENTSRPPSLNTPDPVVFGESDSSCCPTPFLYTTSECHYTSGDNLYTKSNEKNHTSPVDISESIYPFSEDSMDYALNCMKGHKRKIDETSAGSGETDYNNNKTNSMDSSMFSYSSKTPEIGQMYQYQGRPPDISTWTAVNPGNSKYGTGFETNYDQNYVNNFTGDPYLFSYHQQFSENGYNSPYMNGPFSSKPTCTVPPYLQNQSQADAYSVYNRSTNCGNQQAVGSHFHLGGGNTLNIASDPHERTRSSCQFASNQSIDSNNNITGFTSSAAYRLDFSSPVNQEQYQHAWPVPTFVTTPSYLSNLSRPEPVFPSCAPQNTTSKRTATCTSTYSRPSSAMSTHSDDTNTPSIDLTHVSSDEEEAVTEIKKDEVVPETSPVTWSSSNMVVPVRARSVQIMCPLSDLKSKTVKELIKTAENRSESDGETTQSASTESASSPPPAHQKVSESFAAEFVRQRKTKSPISAFCAALDLSKPKKKDRPILPYPCAEPAVPITALLNVNGPTLAYSGSMMVPYLQTVCAANANLSTNNTGTMTSVSSTNKSIGIHDNKISCSQTNSPLGVSSSLTVPSQTALMSFDPYSCNYSTNFTALATPLFPYFPYIEPVATVPLNQARPPNINISNIPLPLYNQLPPNPSQLNHNPQASKQSQTVTQGAQEKSDKQFLCQRNIGQVVSETAAMKKPIVKRETKQSKKKMAPTIPPPIATVGGYTASIQGKNIVSTGPDPPKDSVTYYPAPSRKPESVGEDVGKRVFKARHCNFAMLRIGKFQYSCPTISYEKIARVKFLYSKKKLLYEFQLNDLETAAMTPHRRLTEIEIPFSSVVGLWLFDREMRLEVNAAPTMCLGSKILEKHTKYGVHAPAVYDRHQMVDLTDGQLKTVPYHYVQFRSCCGEKLKTELCKFDGRFSLMLKSPLIEDPHKVLKVSEEPLSHLLDPLPPSGKAKGKGGRSKSCIGCKCETGCSSDLCMCCVRGGTCTEGECLCINCRNPLNILHQLGLPVHRARTDPCLMENIYQIKKLECYVKIQLFLECCQIPLTLLQCIPGIFTCPSIGCGIQYSYSWCCAHLCNEDTEPRNHCIKCGRCTDYRNQHCEICNICYFAGESGTFKCPVCHNGFDEDPLGIESSTDTD